MHVPIFCRYSADMKENVNKWHFECTDFNSSLHVTVCWVYLCVNRIFKIFELMKAWLFSLIKCGWLWKEPVGYSEFSEWRPFALTQACSGSPLVNDFVDDSLWNARPSLNEALLEVSCVIHCSLVNSFLHETPDTVVDRVQVWAVWRPQVGCVELCSA